MWRYQELLPVAARDRVSLGEGMTPLLHCGNLGALVGLDHLYVKDESQNPTWSFKDRLCSVAVSRAKGTGASLVVVSSTGNHGISAAAYSARAGLPCLVLTLEGAPPAVKGLMRACGAMVVSTRAPAERWALVETGVRLHGWFPASNYLDPPVGSPCFGVEGHKTIAYEIAEALSWDCPEFVAVPVAYGDGLAGIGKGFWELERLGLVERVPRLVAVEVSGSLGVALGRGCDRVEEAPWADPVAYSIAVKASTYQALAAIRQSGGLAVRVTGPEILAAQEALASREGLYAEASSAASLAGVARLREAGEIRGADRVACLLTSGGLKQPPEGGSPPVPLVSGWDGLQEALRDSYGFQVH
jgi:threonine synthase